MQSKLQILTVEQRGGTAKKTGQPWSKKVAHCILLNDDGSVAAVGQLDVPRPLEEVAVPGTYTAGFSLEVPPYGDQQGKIVAALKSLTPIKAAVAAVPASKAA